MIPGRTHVAADAASRQLKLRLPLRNRPASVAFQSAQADFATVAATSVAWDGAAADFAVVCLLCYTFTMCAERKILTGLMERRALDAAIKDLAVITDPAQIAQRAQAIAGYGPLALNALIAALDTTNAQLRGGLGAALRALHLPREQVLTALRGAARATDRSVPARLSALTILERFFDDPPDEALLAGLQSSEEAALQSLGELIQAMDQDPLAILEYLAQLGEQPPEVPHMILQAIPAAPRNGHLITLLRMFAQDADRRLAEAALEQLGRLRLPASIRALTALAETLPPALAPAATRGVRKLRLSGVTLEGTGEVSDTPWYAADREWRVLLSPVDGDGAQLAWFVGQAPEAERTLVISIVFEDVRGVINAAGAFAVPAADLPPAKPIGSLHHFAVGEQAVPLLLLEAPFEVGRRAVRAALALNWASETPPPPAYRLLNLPLWLAPAAEFAAPVPLPAADPHAVTGLWDHPAFWGWIAPLADALGGAAVRNADADRDELVTRLVRGRFTAGVVAAYQRRLRRMAEWLVLAGDVAAAGAAQASADQLGAEPPEASPFLRRLIEIRLQAGALARRASKGRAD